MSEDKNEKAHDSFGMIQMGRISGGGMNLFGSSISNDTAIAFRIYDAVEVESYGKTTHRERDQLIEVRLSPNQFSELITTMNVGSGVPCTINWIRGKGSIESPERTNKREVTETMLKDIMSDLVDKIDKLWTDVQDMKSLTRRDRKKLAFDLQILRDHYTSNIPFVETVFHEVMDKAVVEAKSEIDATITHAVNKLGIEALKNKQMLIE